MVQTILLKLPPSGIEKSVSVSNRLLSVSMNPIISSTRIRNFDWELGRVSLKVIGSLLCHCNRWSMYRVLLLLSPYFPLEAILSQLDGLAGKRPPSLSLMLTSPPPARSPGPPDMLYLLRSLRASCVSIASPLSPLAPHKLGKNVSLECHLARPSLPPFFSDGTRNKVLQSPTYVLVG